MSSPVNKRSGSGPHSFDYCRFIELDYNPMEAGIMVSMRQSRGFLAPRSPDHHCRQSPAPVSNRDPYGNASLSSSSNSGSCKGSDGSPTHRRHTKYTSCTDNHGIKPPPPEQYLTPLQQKEVCIRHLRARLKETIERLQDRDTEIDELRTQLSRMQEDWIEEECHRVEAQLALKEARREIQQLKQVIDVVRSSLGETDTGVEKCFQDINLQNHRLETLLQSAELAQGGSAKEAEAQAGGGVVGAGLGVAEGPAGSCEGSPARSLTRSSTYTKLSDQATAAEREGDCSASGSDAPCLSGEGTQDSGFVCCGEAGGPGGRAELLLEAACLQEEAASLLSACSRLPHSATCEALCYGEPRGHPLRCGLGRAPPGVGVSISHPCLSHHHLYLHHLREQGIQTEVDQGPASAPAHGISGPPGELDTIAERTFRSQACSPTSTWMSDEGDDLDSVTTESVTTATFARGPVVMESVATESDPVEDAAVQSVTLLPAATDPAVMNNIIAESCSAAPTATSSASTTTVAVPLADASESPRSPNPQPSPASAQCLHPMVEETPAPQTSQPQMGADQDNTGGVTVIEVEEDEDDEEGEARAKGSGSSVCGVPVKSYWSRHFLVDLLAVAVPVVPTLAWLCRGPCRGGQPVYHIGSLLRGCCTVALHSLRRGGGLRHYPAGGGGPGGMSI